MKQIKINKNIPISASYDWLKLAFLTFRETPLQFASLSFIQIIAMTIFSYFRIGGLVAPVFTAEFAALADNVENKDDIGVIKTLKKLLTNKNLVLLMLVNLLLSLISMFMLAIALSDTTTVTQKILISALLVVFMVTVNMAMWISPVICVFDDVRPLDAMRLSLRVGLYNVLTWLLYAVLASAVLIVLGICILFVATKMFSVGHGFEFWLLILACVILSIIGIVFLAICNIASYHIYKDAFIIEG